MLCWIATFNTVETPVIDHIRIHHQIIQKRIMVSRFDSSRTSYQTSLSWDFLKFTRRIFARDLKKESGTFLRCSKHTECWTNEVDPTARCRVGTEGPFWKHGAPAVPARTPDWNKRKFKVFSPRILVREEVRRFIGSDEKRECPSPARSHFANDFSSRSGSSTASLTIQIETAGFKVPDSMEASQRYDILNWLIQTNSEQLWTISQ